MGYLVLVAFVGLYFTLRDAGSIMVLAPVLAVAAMVLVTISHLIPIGMAYEPGPSLRCSGDESGGAWSGGGRAGGHQRGHQCCRECAGLGGGRPLYAWAIFKTRALPGWIGWLGLVVAALAGWLGLFAPALERGQLDLVVRFSGCSSSFALRRDCDAAPTVAAAAAPAPGAAADPEDPQWPCRQSVWRVPGRDYQLGHQRRCWRTLRASKLSWNLLFLAAGGLLSPGPVASEVPGILRLLARHHRFVVSRRAAVTWDGYSSGLRTRVKSRVRTPGDRVMAEAQAMGRLLRVRAGWPWSPLVC